MNDTSIAQTEPVFVAIDISKVRHEVLIAVPGKKRRRRLTVLNQLDDFNRVITTLSEYGRPVRVAFEATGVPSSPCLMMNAFCASVNFDAFIRFRSSPSQGFSHGKL